MLITLYLGTDIKFETIYQNIMEFLGKAKSGITEAFGDDSDNENDESQTDGHNISNAKKVNVDSKVVQTTQVTAQANTEPARDIQRKPTVIINRATIKDSENQQNPFQNIKIKKVDDNQEPISEIVPEIKPEINSDETIKEVEIPEFKPNFKNIKEKSFTSLDEIEEDKSKSETVLIEPMQIQDENSTNLTLNSENSFIDSKLSDEDISENTKQLNITLNRSKTIEKEPVNLIGTAVLDEEINYKFPGTEFLNTEKAKSFVDEAELEMNARILQEKLETFKIFIENLSVTPGPVVTQYEFVPAAGIKISKIESLSDDLAMALKAKGIRIIAPIPGKGTIGVEIPNANPSIVRFGETVESPKFKNSDFKLPLVMGKTISGDTYIIDLAKMPHLLIAGSTGSGKSVGINTIISSLVYKLHPSELKFVMIDPKKVELQSYSKLKNHYMAASPEVHDTIVTKPEDAVTILKAAVAEMEIRYDILASVRQRNIADYNIKVRLGAFNDNKDMSHKPMPYIVVIIDELADLMLVASKEIEEPITRLAQMARAVGIHLVVATQRPSVDVITGVIKANFPARIAYLVASKIDSRTILDMQGAEQLLGQGDMLCLPPGSPKPVRIQNSFISTDEVEALCDFIGDQKGYSEPYYLPSINEKSESAGYYDPEDRDPLFEEAARLMVQHQQGSVSLIQRRLKVGYARAGRIVDELERAGIIGPFDGSKARLVLIDNLADLDRIL
ncbi:MAG: DNA translocase FtsK [Candidatus Kapabacteria bacterium]|nr:DNA translocase FtsK [Ignavibacteriota bacterium]MCW5884480.1 DNA translocase FtsK [Candidatus Kapabacteria bacterium]